MYGYLILVSYGMVCF